MTLHDVPVAERPRERLQEYGPGALSQPELLALILGRGVAGQPVMAIAHRLLVRFGSLERIAEASVQELTELPGLGVAKACQLKAWAELSLRLQLQLHERGVVTSTPLSPERVAELVRRKLGSYHQEHYIVLSLDVRHKLLGVDTVTIGTLDAALVHPRETFSVALKRHAASIILAHNHPSGDVTPSDEDLVVTKRLVTAGKILGIQVVDHVIVTKTGFLSLKREGLLADGS